MTKKAGILPDTELRALCADDKIRARVPIQDAQIQPASLDLRLGDKAYRLRASFLAGKERSIDKLIRSRKLYEMPLTQSALLEQGFVYIVPLAEELHLQDTGLYEWRTQKALLGV